MPQGLGLGSVPKIMSNAECNVMHEWLRAYCHACDHQVKNAAGQAETKQCVYDGSSPIGHGR